MVAWKDQRNRILLIGREMDRQVTGELIPSCSIADIRIRTLDVRYVLDVKDMLYLETNRWWTDATIRESASENNVKFWRSNVVLSMILYMTTIGHRLSRFSKIRRSAKMQKHSHPSLFCAKSIELSFYCRLKKYCRLKVSLFLQFDTLCFIKGKNIEKHFDGINFS